MSAAAILLCGLSAASLSIDTLRAHEAGSSLSLERIWAIPPDAGHGKTLYQLHCRPCHGSHGWGDGPRAIPALAGQREKYLIAQLVHFAEGRRSGQGMHDTMQQPDLNWPQAIRDLAAFLSTAPRSPGPEYSGDPDLSVGRRLYKAACKDCHGPSAEGTAAGVPALGGQQYRYLTEQLDNFSAEHRDAANPRLPPAVAMASLSTRDVEDIANYLAHLSYLTADNAQ
ncbi:MAG: cytochrome c [Proteobacteria bacterium]|nr:cytochrome c [Pseudomonadota bacterium]